MKFLATVLAVAAVPLIVAAAYPAIRTQAFLGSKNSITGGSYPCELTSGSVEPFGEHSITGTCQNQTGIEMAGVTVCLVATSPGNPPTIEAGSTVSGAASTASVANGKRFGFHPPIPAGAGFSVDLTTKAAFSLPASLLRILITPSVRVSHAGIEADYLGRIEFTPSRARQIADLESHGNAALACTVMNDYSATARQRIHGFRGRYEFPAGEQNRLTNVDLYQSLDGPPVASAAITSATEFSVSGFSLAAGSSYALLLRTASRSSGTTALTLRAEFVH
ncbi:MAG: hypothetical protein JNJ88_06815 [Planctomycetes bacterium]|nr:hypothetical protein [Planctomycetota bacterium]